VLDRIPPRARVRRNAPIELPHVMLLIDDPDKTVIEPLTAAADGMEKVYDFDLMENGGHIKGFKLSASQIDAVAEGDTVEHGALGGADQGAGAGGEIVLVEVDHADQASWKTAATSRASSSPLLRSTPWQTL